MTTTSTEHLKFTEINFHLNYLPHGKTTTYHIFKDIMKNIMKSSGAYLLMKNTTVRTFAVP